MVSLRQSYLLQEDCMTKTFSRRRHSRPRIAAAILRHTSRHAYLRRRASACLLHLVTEWSWEISKREHNSFFCNDDDDDDENSNITLGDIQN